jgi:hypothetical protein
MSAEIDFYFDFINPTLNLRASPCRVWRRSTGLRSATGWSDCST